jgi:N-acetylneuraminic acid mutarotase
MMNRYFNLLLIFFMTILLNKGLAQQVSRSGLLWSSLPPVPDRVGFAGSFAGVSNGALLVAGGANFPDGGAPWTGSAKAWHDHIFVLENPKGKWKEAGKLPYPLGYGASINWKDAVIILGGSNEKGHRAEVFMLNYKNGKIETANLPNLPHAIANTSAALVGSVIYVAGGIEKPDDKVAGANFWALDLNAIEKGWKVLPTWLGAPRMLSVAGAQGDAFYLFSGVALIDGSREYLKDAYRYHPQTGWKKIADLPASVAAAPTPAYALGQSSLQIFGGDDGKLAASAAVLKEKHPGFSNRILNYNTLTNTWTSDGKAFATRPPVTTTLTVWNGNVIIPGGEIRPAVRTPNVLIATYK